ncbi:MAG: ABC transporter permease [Cyclobacteriaceae bacterium]|nr:ABC transporter permease [Cyclobacteriaceae bacterium]
MLQNLILTAWRSLRKNRLFSMLNILGLAVGMTVLLLAAQYVYVEQSYESFLPNTENVYRVYLETYLNKDLVTRSAENYPGAGPALRAEFPEVLGFARLYNMGYKNNVIITNEESKPDAIAFKHRKFLYADSAFLPLLGYPMVSGDPATALALPNTAVISERYARMYFGSEDPLGKSLRLQDDDFNNELVKVTGVFKDLPEETHLKFEVLFSYKTLFSRFERALERYDQSWQRKDMYTFIRLSDNTDPAAFESKLPALVAKYKPGNAERNQEDILRLQALNSIHLTSNLAEEPETNGDKRIVDFISLIALFVLAIAWINYVNLSTAKALERAREVGVRKVLGAIRGQLVRQFLAEAALVNLFAIIAAMATVLLFLPWFNGLSGLSLDFSYLLKPWYLVLILLLWLTGTLLSGFYPAWVLSSFKPVSVLKGKFTQGLRGIALRKTLVVFHFMASVALIAGTVIVYRQLSFMMSRDLGLDIDQVLVVERPGIAPRDRKAFSSAVDVFRDELKRSASVMGVAASGTIPGKQREYKAGIKRYGAPDDQIVQVKFNGMDYEFLDVFKMKVVAGRTFSEQYTNDEDTSMVVTEAVTRIMGFKRPEDAIGQTLVVPDFRWTAIIVGVINDYHQVSLKKPLDPTVFYCSKYGGEFYSIRIAGGKEQEAIEDVRRAWVKAFPGNPFEYFFLDEYFNQQYENERKFGSLFSVFATVAVLVGCLGLFGLSAFTTVQRTKEIGIRKALGSTEQGIFFLLSKEYAQLVGVAILLASPIVWWVMSGWIERFPYHISISAMIFVFAGGMVLVVALLTVSYQTLKAARISPVDSLRHE